MIADIRNVLLVFMRRLDRWLLLRAPMLWRTRLLGLLVLLSLVVTAIRWVMKTSIKDPSEVSDFNTIMNWWLWLSLAVVVLALWVRSIIRKPVGELPPHRHVVTVVAVAIGSSLWLVTPSLLAYRQIEAINRVGLSDQALNSDRDFLSQYDGWRCVPPNVWENASKKNLEQLRTVLARYRVDARGVDLEKGPISDNPACNGNFLLRQSRLVFNSKETIDMIRDARGFESNDTSENQFNTIRISHSWWWVVAIGIGILTAILSYPRYVWRRTFLS
jgi:hypothetical protein